MALRLEINRLLPLYPRGTFVQWDLTGTTEVGVYLFTVERSGSENGPWAPVLVAAPDVYSVLDTVPTSGTEQLPVPAPQNAVPQPMPYNILQTNVTYFYRVTVTPPSGAGGAVSVVEEVEAQLKGYQKMVRRKLLYDIYKAFKHVNGVEIAVLKRVRWGARCNRCFDAFTKETVRGNCSQCFGTGFFPAYFAPVVTLGRRGTSANTKQMTPQGAAEFSSTQVTLMDVPKVAPDDILVFMRDNKRYIVKASIETSLQTVGVHQKLEVSELPRAAPEFALVADTIRTPPLF